MLKNQIFVKFLDKFTVMPKVLIFPLINSLYISHWFAFCFQDTTLHSQMFPSQRKYSPF